jgi:hypothetical protein
VYKLIRICLNNETSEGRWAQTGQTGNMYTVSMGNFFVLRPVLKPVWEWKNVTKMDLRNIGCKNWRKEQAYDLWNEFNLKVLLLECAVKLQLLLSWVTCHSLTHGAEPFLRRR